MFLFLKSFICSVICHTEQPKSSLLYNCPLGKHYEFGHERNRDCLLVKFRGHTCTLLCVLTVHQPKSEENTKHLNWQTILMEYQTLFFRKLIEMMQNLMSAAVVIGALRVNPYPTIILILKMSAYHVCCIWLKCILEYFCHGGKYYEP